MLTEIGYAVDFLCRLIPESASVPPEQRDGWKDALTRLLSQRYRGHWNVYQPYSGNAYRSLTTFAGQLDPTLVQAAAQAQLPLSVLQNYMPRDLVLWVDPYAVSYRIRDGSSVFTLYEDKSQVRALGLKSTSDLSFTQTTSAPVSIRPPSALGNAPYTPANQRSHHRRTSSGASSTTTAVSGGRHTPSPSGASPADSFVAPSDSGSSSTLSSPKTPTNTYTRLPPPGLGKATGNTYVAAAAVPQHQQAYYPAMYTNYNNQQLSQGNNAAGYYLHPQPTSQMYC
ncbi:hypothetical protein IWQ60_001805 [Tieghemiomyces parasiticus]|uniref:Anti-proliferative protein domain-containing protein n=1 Tax=Tieghemiomyces parasiticus TaxID=78921 RepID=A0A9W8ADG0_9FUNG|nr:hypothetical protein IWQ60_001805 [Tieghemiomyces parasiticus]